MTLKSLHHFYSGEFPLTGNTLILDKDSELAKLLYGSFEMKETPISVPAPAAVNEEQHAEEQAQEEQQD